MSSGLVFTFILVAMAAVVVVLFTGIGSFAKGGKFNRKYGNKLMQMRVLLQFVAVLAILLFVWLRNGG